MQEPGNQGSDSLGLRALVTERLVFCQDWWLPPVILAHGRLKQDEYCKFQASLGYIMSSRHPGPQSEILKKPTKIKKN